MPEVGYVIQQLPCLNTLHLKGTRFKRCFRGDKTDITHNWVLVLSVNIPTKAFCPPACILSLSSESCFSTFGRIDWVGWRLARGEDGRGWSTRVPHEIHHFSLYGNSQNCLKYGLFYFSEKRAPLRMCRSDNSV